MNLASAIVADGKFQVEIISKSGVFQIIGDKFVFLKEFKTTDKKTWHGDICHIYQVLSYLRHQREKFSLIHFHSISQMSMFLGCLLLLATKLSYNCELIYKVTRTGTSAPIGSNMRRPLYRLCFFLHTLFNTKFIILTRSGQDELVDLGVNPDKVVLIPNGINVALWRSSVEWKERKNIYLVVSRLIKRKNVIEIIRAWGKSNTRETRQLLIVGDGPEASNLREVASSSTNANQIRFLGHQNQEQIRELMKQARFYISSSTGEGLSNSLLEAMASGMVPIVKKIPQNSAVVDDTVNGFLYSSSDDLASLLASIPEQSIGVQLSALSRKKVETCFAMEGVVDKYISLISPFINLKR